MTVIPAAFLGGLYFFIYAPAPLPFQVDRLLLLLFYLYACISLFPLLGEDNLRPLVNLFIIAMGCRFLGSAMGLIYSYQGSFLKNFGLFGDPGIIAFYLITGGGITIYCRLNQPVIATEKWYIYIHFILVLLPLAHFLRPPVIVPSLVYHFMYYWIICYFIYKILRFPIKYKRITPLFINAIVLILVHDLLLGVFNFFDWNHLLFFILPFILAGCIFFPAGITKGES